MTRYHINHEGKIYPCRARVLRCPYSESLHSEDKVELYYRLMTTNKDEVEPSKEAEKEMLKFNRLRSLYSLSDEIEKSNSPVELIIYTLNQALKEIRSHDLDWESEEWDRYEESQAEDAFDLLARGRELPPNVPHDIAVAARVLLKVRGEYHLSHAAKIEANILYESISERDYSEYQDYWKNSLNKNNYYGTHKWIARDFENFTRDLNASRMITQPVFFGDVQQAKETIKAMDGYELLATFDDYSLTDKEIELAIEETNNFEYEPRRDLSEGANRKLKEWYDRNREIYSSWKINTSKRILLSMEIAEELDRRKIFRQDGSVGKMIEESEE